MSSWTPNNGVQSAQGKTFVKQTIRSIGKCVKKGYLKMRMKADDSKAVLMSDSKLGKGISSE